MHVSAMRLWVGGGGQEQPRDDILFQKASELQNITFEFPT